MDRISSTVTIESIHTHVYLVLVVSNFDDRFFDQIEIDVSREKRKVNKNIRKSIFQLIQNDVTNISKSIKKNYIATLFDYTNSLR